MRRAEAQARIRRAKVESAVRLRFAQEQELPDVHLERRTAWAAVPEKARVARRPAESVHCRGALDRAGLLLRFHAGRCLYSSAASASSADGFEVESEFTWDGTADEPAWVDNEVPAEAGEAGYEDGDSTEESLSEDRFFEDGSWRPSSSKGRSTTEGWSPFQQRNGTVS